MRRLTPLLLVPVLLLAACAKPGGSRPSGEGPAEVYRPDDVVLRVESVGGFVPVDTLLTRVPEFTIYGDGRVLTPGVSPAIYPPFALTGLGQQRLSADAVDRVVTMAIEAGIGDEVDYGTPGVADLPDTHLVVVTSAGTRETSVYALGFDTTEGLTPQQEAARRKLVDFTAKLYDLVGTFGAEKVTDEGLYPPTSMALVVRPWTGDVDPTLPQAPRDWPGPALPGDPVRSSPDSTLSCLTVTGDELGAVLDAAQGTNTLTPWVWAGQSYLVAFRPLLPDEGSCADLG